MTPERMLVSFLDVDLQIWESWWLLVAVADRLRSQIGQPPICSNTGAAANSERFRQWLLQLHQRPDLLRLLDQRPDIAFAGLSDFAVPRDFPNPSAQDRWFHLSLAVWSASRRIFNLDSDIQEILLATDLNEVLWGDLLFPFAGFGIQLAELCVVPGVEPFDFLLVTKLPLPSNQCVLNISCYSTRKSLEHRPMDPQVYASLTALRNQSQQQSWIFTFTNTQGGIDQQVLMETVDRMLQVSTVSRSCYGFSLPMDPTALLVTQTASMLDSNIARSSEELSSTRRACELAVRLAVGLILYLDGRPPGSPNVSVPHQPLRSGLPDPNAITSAAGVCDVTATSRLKTEVAQRRGEKTTSYELSWHIRRAHKRRLPGQGDNPEAEKTVEVKQTIVRRDRMPPGGGLPGGGITEVGP